MTLYRTNFWSILVMGGDNILEDILADEEDPYDAYINFDNDW